jgi:hypothetical protein
MVSLFMVYVNLLFLLFLLFSDANLSHLNTSLICVSKVPRLLKTICLVLLYSKFIKRTAALRKFEEEIIENQYWLE